MEKKKFHFKRKLGPVAGVTAAMSIMIGSAYTTLTSDAFIDVGDVTELAGHDTSLFDKDKSIQESQNIVYGVFQNVEEEVMEEGTEAVPSEGVYYGDNVNTAQTGDGSTTGAEVISVGDGTGGEVVDTIGATIPVYTDTTKTGGTVVSVKAAFQSKGVSNYNNWAGYEHSCYESAWLKNGNIKKVTGYHLNDSGNLVDSNDRVLAALGPAVMNPSRDCSQQATAEEMRYGTEVDVILEKDSTQYYLHITVADCKAHTYPSGIIQTGYKISGGTVGYVSPNRSDSTWTPMEYTLENAQKWSNCLVEFCCIAQNSIAGASNYDIIGFIVY